MTRIFYCPKCGRVEERDVAINSPWASYDLPITQCEHCLQWYYATRRFKAKRAGES